MCECACVWCIVFVCAGLCNFRARIVLRGTWQSRPQTKALQNWVSSCKATNWAKIHTGCCLFDKGHSSENDCARSWPCDNCVCGTRTLMYNQSHMLCEQCSTEGHDRQREFRMFHENGQFSLIDSLFEKTTWTPHSRREEALFFDFWHTLGLRLTSSTLSNTHLHATHHTIQHATHMR